MDGGNEWGNEDPVHIYPRLGKFGQLRDCLDVGPGQKRYVPVPGKSLLVSVFSLENEHTKD